MWKDNTNCINRRKKPDNMGLILYDLNLIKESFSISFSTNFQNQVFSMTDSKCLNTVSMCIYDLCILL